MKWKRKYDIDLKMVHRMNRMGFSLVEIGNKYNIPRTTLNRYLSDAGYEIYNNKYRTKVTQRKIQTEREEFTCPNAWKRALVRKFGNKCMVCGYTTIIEAHHVVPQVDGGKTSISNGSLLCPNHHAEAHAGLINVALVKREELLENPVKDNQHPSLERKWIKPPRVKEGSTTNARAKAVKATRASRILYKDEDIV